MESRLPRFATPSRRLVAAGSAALLGGVLLGVAGDSSAAAPLFTTVRTGTISATVGAAGSVQSGRIRELGFATAGTVTKVNVHNGQTVKAGDVLAELDNTQAAEAVNAAVAALAAANEADANVGTSPSPSASGSGGSPGGVRPSGRPSGSPSPSPTRTVRPSGRPSGSVPPGRRPTTSPSVSPSGSPSGKPTHSGRPSTKPSVSPGGSGGGGGRSGGAGGSGSGSGAPMTQQQADANVLKAQVALNQARRALAGTEIVAPTAGTVLSVAGTVGTTVNGPGSSGFVTLGNLDELQVQADFSESDVAKLKIGQAATVTLAAGNAGPFDGTVAHIEPAATTSGSLVQYGVMISFNEPPGHLLIGQSATVQVTTDQAQDALYIPRNALHPAPNGGYTVLLDKHGSRRVQIGISGDQYVEIRSGLAAGDRVLL